MGNPTFTPLTEIRHAGGYIVFDPSDGHFTAEEITVLSGAGVVTAGTVLGKTPGGAATVAAKGGGNTGNGTFVIDATTPVLVGGKLGVYTLRNVLAQANGGVFELRDPDQRTVGLFPITIGAGGTVTVADQIKGVLTDAGTDFVLGDGFDITVTAVTPKFVPYDPTGTDGRQWAAAILFTETVDATAADKKAAATVSGPCRVNASELVWGANVTTAQQKTNGLAQLKALGIRAV